MTYIKLLTTPLIILAGLALLTACGGGVAVTNNIGEININNGNPCDTQPFGDDCGADYDEAKVTLIRECLKGNNAASAPLCAPAIDVHSCIDDPFTEACGLDPDFADYINEARTQRTTFCGTNPENTAFCAESVKFNELCRGNNDIFNTRCSTDVAGRLRECIMHGIGAGGHATCAGILVAPCTTDPFTNTHCESATGISGIRARYCANPLSTWDDDCSNPIYTGVADARDMACLDYGTNADAGGDATCAMRPNVTEACGVETPFAHPVCDEVANIDRLRTTFCQIPDNAFTTGCETDGTHGNVDTARDVACLADLSAGTGCAEREKVKEKCEADPLLEANAGCVDLPNYRMLLIMYCEFGNRATTISGCDTTPAVVCEDKIFNPSAISRTGTIDCLADTSFAPARITACATEAETSRCDTAEIAPVICSASGANANPFAAFCATATNIGGDKTVVEIRQSALTACFDGMSDDDKGICQNTMGTRTMLATNCLLEGAFADGCDYIEYAPQKTMFCNAESTAWNMLCDGETIGTTAASRDTACLANANADARNMGSDTRCGLRTKVIAACPAENPFAHVGCNNIAGIDVGFRTSYCAESANLFKSICRNGTHGMVFINRREACLKFGTDTMTGGDASCDSNTFAEDECAKNPFDDTHPGCQSLLKIETIVETYCSETKPSDPQCGVKTSSWVRSFGEGKAPPARLDNTVTATERKRQFLTGLATGLDETGTVQVTIPNDQKFTLTLGATGQNSARYNGEPLGGDGDASDGVAGFFDTVGDNSQVYYAGLLSDTDLGAPLTEPSGSATWYGQIQIWRDGLFQTTSAHDFTLKITFGMKSGVPGSVGSIEGGDVERVIGSATHQYHVAGTYDAGGVITGTTTHVGFAGADAGQLATAIANETGQGILTGLIGAQGAVGVFISGNAGSTKDNIIGAASVNGTYAGGFVAAPYIPAEDDDADKVTFRDWLRGFNYPLHTSAAVADAGSTAPSHFIKPKADGTLDLTGVTMATVYPVSRAGDVNDGFVYTAGTIGGRTKSFVGILPSTDLGAPLIDAIAMLEWSGQFSFGSTETLTPIDFTLTFDGMDSGTINGTAEVLGADIIFALMFDGKGIITGDVTSAASGLGGTAPARGLIGEEGLVGVFANINGAISASNLFGGFVAAPRTTNQAAWAKSFNGGVPATLTQTTIAANRKRQFLAGDETKLDDTLPINPITYGLTFASAMYNGAALTGDNDIKDGFAGVVDTVSSVLKVYYVGILSGTDLGRPLTETHGSITWNGQIEIYRADGEDISKDFSLKITLGEVNDVEGSLGAIYGIVQSSGTNHYELTGTYDAKGVISGEVTYAAFTGSPLATTASSNGILSGLIGEQGAVGVFLAGSGTKEAITDMATANGGYAGGFVVSGAPPPRQPVIQPADTNANQVTFKDWLRDFGEFPPPSRMTTPPRERKREFLAGGTEKLETRGAVNVNEDSNITANLASLGRSGDAADGYNYFFDTVAPNTYIPYAGLLSGTDLGAPVSGNTGTTVTWHGKLRATLNGTVHTNSDLALRITYGGTGDVAGSIAGEVKTNTNNLYELRGNYTDSGVISGTVYYGRVNSGSLPNLVRTFPNEDPNGFLTGLIGAQGAVGVFIAGTGTKEAITVPEGNYYAGGFVVAPPQ